MAYIAHKPFCRVRLSTFAGAHLTLPGTTPPQTRAMEEMMVDFQGPNG